MSIAVGSDAEWAALRQVLADPALQSERFAGPAERWRNQDALDAIVEGWTRERSADVAVEALQRAGVPALRVQIEDSVATDPQLLARGFLQEIEHPVIGRRRVLGVPWRFEAGGVGIHSPAPRIGQHNAEVLGGLLGLSPEEIDRLVADGVVR